MNLGQAIVHQQMHADLERELARVRRLLDERDLYRIAKFFHDCGPGCKPAPKGTVIAPDFGSILRFAGHGLKGVPVAASPRIDDHVPLPGNERPTCRVLYYQSLRFFEAAKRHRERVYLAANRIGKTETAAFEVTAHLTGVYPAWWPGVKYEGPIQAWAAGDTRQTTRDISQTSLLGRHEGVPTKQFSGMIPPHLIEDIVRATGGVANCIDTVYVRHVEKHHGAPCISELGFKSYDQGRRVFQGTEKHLIWLDEEPPDGAEAQESQAQGSSEIWTECLLRTMTQPGGMLLATFTPLRGMTPFLRQYFETCVMPGTEDPDVEVPARASYLPDSEEAA